MSELKEILNDSERLEEIMRESLFGASAGVDAYCKKCGEYVTTAEPDASWTGGGGNIECPCCGPGTRIASVLRFAGFM